MAVANWRYCTPLHIDVIQLLMMEYLVWTSWKRRRRRSLCYGSSAGYRCRWLQLRRISPARCTPPALSAQSRRTDDPGVRCRAAAWAQWSVSGRGLSPEQPGPSSQTAPTHCDGPVTVKHINNSTNCTERRQNYHNINSNNNETVYSKIRIISSGLVSQWNNFRCLDVSACRP